MGSELNMETMARIRAFCKTITAAERLDESICQELSSHMEDKVRAYLDGTEAISEADAVLLVERHFGSQELVRELLQTVCRDAANTTVARSRGAKIFSRALTTLSLACLFLLMATGLFWVRSYWISDTVGRVGQAKVVCFKSIVGSLSLGVTVACPDNESPGPRPYYFYNAGNCKGSRGWVSGSSGKVIRFAGHIDTKSGYMLIVVPHWFAALLLSALPLRWVRVSERLRRLGRWASGNSKVSGVLSPVFIVK